MAKKTKRSAPPAGRKPAIEAEPVMADLVLQSNDLEKGEGWLRLWQRGARDAEQLAYRCLESGRILEAAGHDDRALAHLADGLALEPVREGVAYLLLNNTGCLLNRKARFAEGERFCRAAMRVDRLRFSGQKNLGVALAGQGRVAEAALHLINASRGEPRDPRAFHRLEDLAIEHRAELLPAWPDLDRHLESLRRSVEHWRPLATTPLPEPTPADALPLPTRRACEHAARAQSAFDSGRASQAIAECDLGLAWDSPSYAARLLLLQVRSRALVLAPRHAEENLACAHDAVELDPYDVVSWRVYGAVLLSCGRHEDAARAYLNALRVAPGDTDALKLLRSLVRRFGKQIEQRMPDLRERVKRAAKVQKKARPASQSAAGEGRAAG